MGHGSGLEWPAPTLAELVEPVLEVDPVLPALELDRLFLSSAELRAVVVRTSPPVVVSREHFQHVITGRWGYGRALHDRVMVGAMELPPTLALEGSLSAFAAAEEILVRTGDPGYEHVLVVDGDAILGVVSASRVMRSIAEQYAHRATHDPLTGLANRSGLIARLETDRQAAGRDGHTALLFVDLDRFKLVNDSLGHAVGDRLLVAVAERIAHCLRGVDLACRLGGDEFVALLHDVVDAQDAAEVGRRLLDAIEQPVHVAGHVLRPTASVGVAVGLRSRTDPEELLRHADLAMYEAKGHGRGRLQVFELDLERRAGDRFDLDSRLRRAVQDGEFHLHFQPIVDLVSGRTVKLEALVRWDDPERGMVGPAEFIPAAEESGLVVPLGMWVLEQACTEMRASHGEPDGPNLAVNVSARQLQEPDFVRDVIAVLHETGWPADRLCLEVTERVALRDMAVVHDRMSALAELGVEFALDDFGTGYSSLSVLRDLPFAELKIDRTFLARITTSSVEEAVVGHIVQLAGTLGRHITAEGIETAEQLATIMALGCDRGQGFLLAEPAPLACLDLAARVS